jgi:cytochrome c-type biogenesis protein CcmH
VSRTTLGRKITALLSLAALGGVLATPALSQVSQPRPAPEIDNPALMDRDAEELDARAAEIAAELRCPVCRNQSVVESNADLSREMQALVRERLEAGDTPEEVKEYFVSRYGEWILLEPQRRGINWLVWGLPFVVLISGALFAVMLLRRWAASTPDADSADQASAPGLTPENERWLQEALRDS